MDITALRQRRGQVKSRNTRMLAFLDAIDAGQTNKINQAEDRLNKYESAFDEFNDVQCKIEEVDAAELNSTEREEFEDAYFDIIARCAVLLAKYKESQNRAYSASQVRAYSEGQNTACSENGSLHSVDSIKHSSHIKLPTIELPIFNGEYANWLSFRDIFSTMIHDNDGLSDVQKMHYLKSSLKSTAALVIADLPTTAQNYKIAWNMVQERFENNKILIKTHVDSILDSPGLQRESAKGLRELSDNLLRNVRALKSLNKPTNEWGTLLVNIIVRKLDAATKRAWEMLSPKEDDPTFEELVKFLADRAQILENLEHKVHTDRPKHVAKSYFSSQSQCADCSKSHKITSCGTFLSKGISERFARVKQLKLCINCLQPGHMIVDCNSSSCKKCNKKHHTLLHLEKQATTPARPLVKTKVESDSKNSSPPEVQATSGMVSTFRNVLLSTAIVMVKSKNGDFYKARVLLDSGSQISFVSQHFANKLKLTQNQEELSLMGIGGTCKGVSTSTTLAIQSIENKFRLNVKCYIIEKITGQLPSSPVDVQGLEIPTHIRLADPEFYKPQFIDILLGADVFYNLLCVGQIKLGTGLPILQKTTFGWVISGILPHINNRNVVVCNLSHSLEEQLTRFWEIEDIKSVDMFTEEELLCEKTFKSTFSRTDSGRFIVSLPLTSALSTLGNSYDMALKRFMSLERKLEKNEELKKQYVAFMEEYEELGHMSKIVKDDTAEGYYLPHHAVHNEDSLTTKLRVVFDGSAPTATGVSINDVQAAGPQIQDELISITIRFRFHEYVLTADITKMYRQVLVTPEHRKYQKILWRPSIKEEIATYTLNTVTYGMKPSSFLATRCLKELANTFRDKYPRACSVIERDYYVDDLLTGCNNVQELAKLKEEVDLILKSGCFELRKWSSNHPGLLSNPEKGHTTYCLNPETTQKTLGLFWTPATDVLQCIAQGTEDKRSVTKRTILSLTAQIYDPLGLVSPVIVVAKLILQKLWHLNLSWDESIPLDLHTKWTHFYNTLNLLEKIEIPRLVVGKEARVVEIHGFADASELAYGACLYVRSIDDAGNIFVQLLCSRSRVAPLKPISLPRLELCASVLLIDLVKKAREALRCKIKEYSFWSDSQIALAWIRTDPKRWKTFVCNRVAKIQRHSQISDWHHVSSGENPADLISRGTTSQCLLGSSLWWQGPTWLGQSKENWPNVASSEETGIPEARDPKSIVMVSTLVVEEPEMLERFSSINKLLRIIAYCFRFKTNALKENTESNIFLTASEIDTALLRLVKLHQQVYFETELETLSRNGTLNSKSKLLCLRPFLDEKGLIRVGGRLSNAFLPFDQKHPFVLSSKGRFVALLIEACHRKLLHAGLQCVLSTLRRRFWIISAKAAIKTVLRRCITCCKANPVSFQQIMGDLPADRLQEVIPFTVTGVDFGGPMSITESHRRGKAKLIRKCYIAVFVCFSSKAVHLELVSDLTTDAFIACFRRFISRRGSCKILYSDNATNFVGADNDFRRQLRQAWSDTKRLNLPNYIASEGVTWKFIPPRSPHHGGLWEAAVKSVKYHIKRTVGETLLTFEEYCTLLCQVEACLNSRPITSLSSDPNDMNALTPFHFLIGQPITQLPEIDLSNSRGSNLSRWQHLQKMRQDIWKRWSREYLHQLQQRSKWISPREGPRLDDLVLLIEENLPPLRWSLGRIVELHPGKDQRVRVVSVKTQSGVCKRSINKLCKVPV